ncbi:AI-2E family transporter [Pararhizobium sp. DWP1-1-3]|uniref:AI-2E family transporter n=1 Tax=Pararhizobium sp. DWP1-1-3 TaxID=2804652 RepID=UPI003CFA1508
MSNLTTTDTGGTAPSSGTFVNTTLSGRMILILIGAAVLLRVGQDIFVPLALSLLLTFTLAPIVTFLRKRYIPKIAAVVLTVASAFLVIATFSFIVAGQVANLADNIPTYQRNIIDKVHALREAGTGTGIFEHLTKVVERVGAEMQNRATETRDETPSSTQQREPLPVEIVTPSKPIETLVNVILPLISPFATAGLVIVLVIFMLLEREDLRDRFIRLVGLGDLHRTTAALQDAGTRVGKYLLMQLVVNSLYAVPITLGLWLLGIPNAILWGLFTLVLRFVPYIGPVIGMILPLLLALAISPGWSLVAWVAALFITIEVISNNVIEPWLYGSHTGLSPLAIIISAIFWSWLWGPLGLMLSTPLTVCLVVLGRYVPQFSFLDVLLGNEPVLQPQEKLYQRLLAGDPSEATDNAEDFLEEGYLIDYYENVGLPALLLGEMDRQRGVMTETQIALVAASMQTLIGNLADMADEEEKDEELEQAQTDAAEAADELDLPDGRGRSILCLGGRGAMDNAVASMLAQILAVQGAHVADNRVLNDPQGSDPLEASNADTVLIAFLNGNSKSQARQIIRRLKRRKPSLRVGIVVPMADSERSAQIAPDEINADFVSLSLTEATRSALSNAEPVALKSAVRPLLRPRPRLNPSLVA